MCEESKWTKDVSRKYFSGEFLRNTKVNPSDILAENPIDYTGREVGTFFFGIACGDYSGSVVKTQIQSFYNELIYIVEKGEGYSPTSTLYLK